MTALIAGADRDGVRVLVVADGTVQLDRYLPAPAKLRNERAVIGSVLHDAGSGWGAFDAYYTLAVPHSHTSVRVVSTILHTTAWYAGKPFTILPVDSLRDAPHATVLGLVA